MYIFKFDRDVIFTKSKACCFVALVGLISSFKSIEDSICFAYENVLINFFKLKYSIHSFFVKKLCTLSKRLVNQTYLSFEN